MYGLDAGMIVRSISKWLGGFTLTFWLGLCALLLALNGVSYCKGRADGKALEARKWEAAQAKAEKRAGEANVKAVVSRAEDEQRNEANDQARKDAAASGGRHDANCVRLRQAGVNPPASCGGR